ncbi:hypothetical protein IAQ61_003930, partial [Plenodomus lingam]
MLVVPHVGCRVRTKAKDTAQSPCFYTWNICGSRTSISALQSSPSPPMKAQTTKVLQQLATIIIEQYQRRLVLSI